jgi:chromosome segregation ATPase
VIIITLTGIGTIQIDDAAVLAGIADLKSLVTLNAQRQEAFMSETQQKLDELKAAMSALVADVNAVLDSMAQAKDDPAELQALIDEAKAATASIDAVLNPPPPPTPAP